MISNQSPEDEKFLKSLNSILQISEKHDELQQKEQLSDDDEVSTMESENQCIIPAEQSIPPAERIEPLQSMVEPDFVRKVMREMDTMSTEQLKQALMKIKVSTGGNKKTLRKRVAQYYRKENSLLNRKLEPNSDKTSRYFDYLIATDFECTCVEVIYDYPHEIIELPAVLIDVREMKVISEFRSYVRPIRNPKLSDFCVEFTKIAQETVDEAPYFREALEKLVQWMRKFGLGEKNTRFSFVTDGPHDMWKFMQFQCILSNIRMPHMFRNFINIKKTFKEKFNGLVKGNGKSGIENMLERLQLKFVGNKHSGLDDARNIAAIAIQMMKLKIELRINQKCSWIEPKNQSQTLKDDDDLVGDNFDVQTMDVSRRDFQLWLRRLPLKLSSVTRREFLNEEYLDCESCDELTDDKHDRQSLEEKMIIREEVEQLDEEERVKFKNDDYYTALGPTNPRSAQVSNRDVDDSGSDEEYYRRQFEMLEIEEAISSIPTPADDIELDSIWERIESDEDGNMRTPITLREDVLASSPLSTSSSVVSTFLPTSEEAEDVKMDSNSEENMAITAPPPKNSLASTNRHNRHY